MSLALLSNKSSALPARQGTRNAVGARRNPIARAPRSTASVTKVASPTKEQVDVNIQTPVSQSLNEKPQLISKEHVVALEAELDQGPSMAALRRFNANLRKLPADRWEEILTPVFNELSFNLESFNPAFTACMLMVQRTIGRSDYVRRDMALKNLIQPLAGEYGMHNDQPQAKTHRELFSDFYASLFHAPLEGLLAQGVTPVAAQKLWNKMISDIMTGGGRYTDPMEQAAYALGYNLAIEYLADFEKTWMLDSFRDLHRNVLSQQGRQLDWVFLEVHAEGEAEHAAIGHNAVLNFVPEQHLAIMRQAMQDHDRDLAEYYNKVADMLQA